MDTIVNIVACLLVLLSIAVAIALLIFPDTGPRKVEGLTDAECIALHGEPVFMVKPVEHYCKLARR